MNETDSIEECPLVNGKRYPLWSSFVRQKENFIGCKLRDFDMGEMAETVVTDITLKPNGKESAMFCVEGVEFGCGGDVQFLGINSNDPGWITFYGYGGHKWQVESKPK